MTSKRARRRHGGVTEVERAWATGTGFWAVPRNQQPRRPTADEVALIYFMDGRRLREIWQEVHGEPLEAYIARRPESVSPSGGWWVRGVRIDG